MPFHVLLNMTHDQIHLIRIVVQSGSLARAAIVLGLDPSTLSKSLRRMEERLGTAILTRHAKGITPTAAGQMLLDHFSQMSNQSKITFEKIRQSAQRSDQADFEEVDTGKPVISIASEMSELLLGPAFAQLNGGGHPEVTLAVQAGAHIEQLVIAGDSDLGVICGAPVHDDLDCAKMAEEGMMLVFGPSLQNAMDGLTPRMHALADLPLLVPTWEHSSRRFLEQQAIRAGVRLRILAEIGDFAALKILLRQGLGYAVLPHCTVREEAARGTLCTIPLRGGASRIALSMIWRRAASHHPNLRATRQDLAACLTRVISNTRSDSMRLLAASA
jgi:LysR family nitrogen assimilation transcriptional regulator